VNGTHHQAVCFFFNSLLILLLLLTVFVYYPLAVNCGPLSNPPDGKVELPQGTLLDNLAFYSCTSGYLLVGATNRRCQDNSAWSGAPPTCRRELGICIFLFVCLLWGKPIL